MVKLNEQKVKNYFKRGVALVTGVIMAGTMTACGKGETKKDTSLVSNILKGSYYAEVNGDPTIIRPIYLYRVSQESIKETEHTHYIDVISGCAYTDSEDCKKSIYYKNEWIKTEIVDINNKRIISDALTAEEIEAANNEELTIQDMIDVIDRMYKEKHVEENGNVLKK